MLGTFKRNEISYKHQIVDYFHQSFQISRLKTPKIPSSFPSFKISGIFASLYIHEKGQWDLKNPEFHYPLKNYSNDSGKK